MCLSSLSRKKQICHSRGHLFREKKNINYVRPYETWIEKEIFQLNDSRFCQLSHLLHFEKAEINKRRAMWGIRRLKGKVNAVRKKNKNSSQQCYNCCSSSMLLNTHTHIYKILTVTVTRRMCVWWVKVLGGQFEGISTFAFGTRGNIFVCVCTSFSTNKHFICLHASKFPCERG